MVLRTANWLRPFGMVSEAEAASRRFGPTICCARTELARSEPARIGRSIALPMLM